MSLLKKFKRLLLGASESEPKIKVTEVSPKKPFRNETVKKEFVSKDYSKSSTSDRKPKTQLPPERKPRQEAKPSEKPSEKPNERRSEKPSEKYSEKPQVRQPRFNRPPRFKDDDNKSFKNNFRNKKRKGKGAFNENMDALNPDSVKIDFGNWSVSEFEIPTEEGKKRFHDFSIPDKVMRGVFDAGYQYCTPIQSLILPESFKGSDVSGKAQTGTGKTAAFLITIFKHMLEKPRVGAGKTGSPRALIMAPTRELVIQIEKDARVLGKYCNLTIQSVFGGINYERQRKQLVGKQIDILVATPGRLLDYKEQDVLHLDEVEILVIDEADRMLDMGFIPDMKQIISSTPPKGVRQTMLFSATLSPDILKLASQWTKNPLSFEVEAREVTAAAINQLAYIATNHEKFAIIYNSIEIENLNRVIVFGNRRDEVSKLTDMFRAAGVTCGLLSGDVSQAKRIRTLEDLREGRIRVLCATDVAARGIHVDDVTHVFNFSLPDDPEDYVHRIGRTGRAGASGVSVLFATEEDAYFIPQIEKFTGHKLNYINPDETLTTLPPEIAKVVPAMRSFSSRARKAPKQTKKFGAPRSGSSSSRPRSGSSTRRRK